MLRISMLFIMSLFLSATHAQTDPLKVKKQVQDPKTKENAAKADRHVSRDHAIFDSSNKTMKKGCRKKKKS